jgi:hypothetical protein
MKTTAKVYASFLLLSLLLSLQVYSADTESDYNEARVKVLNIQAVDTNLPSALPVDDRK